VTNKKDGSGSVKAAFGAVNRNRLINEYFAGSSDTDAVSGADRIADAAGGAVAPHSAWQHVYRLLLWADQTTGLAHCYESDKSQPGKNWYSRSLAFHDWVTTALRSTPGNLAGDIDWLFRRATADLAAEVLRNAKKVAASAATQRAPYDGRNFPKPGEDPELIAIMKEVLGNYISADPSPDTWQFLVQRIRQYLAVENKRKNLVGEGFEDVLSHVVRRACPSANLDVSARRLLHDIPGFNRGRRGDKPNKVDVAVLRPPDRRTLVTAKWSVRADREKQFAADFVDYLAAESERLPFEYVFVTNEFDPARLMRACDQLGSNAPMFTHVVHINTDALRATYGANPEASMRRVVGHIDSGRLISLGSWLERLA